jgi:hypothetical protein
MLLVYLILFLINIIQIESELASCRQTFGTNTYDLNQLSQLTITGQGFPYAYAITPCGIVPTSQCGPNGSPFEPGMTACQENILDPSNPRFESAMGFLDGYGKLPNIEFIENTDGPGTGVIMTMRNARCSGLERLVKVTFICDQGVKTPTDMDVNESPSCQFTIKIKAAGACPVGSDGPNTGGGSSGIGGTVFVIILLVVVVAYLVGGVLYNRFKQDQTGLAMLPHPSFWLLVFGSFLSGCRVTLTFIRTCGKESSYNSV